VVLRFGLWPAAKAIWSAGRLGGQAAGEIVRIEDVRFVDGRLTAEGMEPLDLPRLAAKAHEHGLVTAAMVHGYNRWSWAEASFDLPDGRYTGAIDALAVRYGNRAAADRKALMTIDGYHRLDRATVTFPPTLFERIEVGYTSAAGCVVAIEIDKVTGAIAIRDAVTVLECGRPLVPEQIAGQAEGGLAMGARATRSLNICRSTRTAPATAPGISTATGSCARPACRSGIFMSTRCRHSGRPTCRKGSANWS
jgi:CO/xanthine dehydrogenase Mo-binding subunit